MIDILEWWSAKIWPCSFKFFFTNISGFYKSDTTDWNTFVQVPEGKAVFAVSPVLLMKDSKSDIEAQGMQNAHIRDAVALCQFLSMLEEGVSYEYNKSNS